ncbi:adenylate/guanylate cyclase domain-containing protein [Variovorax humicola]|uniref:adenylate/guanylate cyclase domain-containing protein n=1 Tax=Variovorax humicola TaxID=1769758 RepID=UPI003BF4BE0E
MAYFGYPLAHEDDAQRAIRAGLEIIDRVDRIAQKADVKHPLKLAVRVGIHSGLVVAGEMGSGNWRETLAVGETPNVAARLQALAQPNTLVKMTTCLSLRALVCRPLAQRFVDIERQGQALAHCTLSHQRRAVVEERLQVER